MKLTRGSALASHLAFVDGAPVGAATTAPSTLAFPSSSRRTCRPPSPPPAAASTRRRSRTRGASSRFLPGSAAVLSGASGPSPSFVPDVPGSYELQLVLTDQLGRTSRTTLALDASGAEVAAVGSCGTRAPTVAARVTGPVPSPASGTPVEPPGTPVQLDASGSQSPDAIPFAPDGSGGCGLPRLLRYEWSLVSVPPGSTAALGATHARRPAHRPRLPGAVLAARRGERRDEHRDRLAAGDCVGRVHVLPGGDGAGVHGDRHRCVGQPGRRLVGRREWLGGGRAVHRELRHRHPDLGVARDDPTAASGR